MRTAAGKLSNSESLREHAGGFQIAADHIRKRPRGRYVNIWLRKNLAGNAQPLNRKATLVIFAATLKVGSKRVTTSAGLCERIARKRRRKLCGQVRVTAAIKRT